MTGQCDTFEPFVHAAASHECSSHVTGLSAVRAAIGLARSVIERVTAAEARSFTDRDTEDFANILSKNQVCGMEDIAALLKRI